MVGSDRVLAGPESFFVALARVLHDLRLDRLYPRTLPSDSSHVYGVVDRMLTLECRRHENHTTERKFDSWTMLLEVPIGIYQTLGQ